MTEALKWLKTQVGERKAYAIPKSGLIVALMADLSVVERVEDADVIVDDIIDSGKTIEPYLTQGKPIYTLYVKPHTPYKDKVTFYKEESGWVFHWWEEKENKGEDWVMRFLEFHGENPTREGLKDTPHRVTEAYAHILGGYSQNLTDVLTTFQNESAIDQIVGLSNIEFYSTCEHHMLPFFGKAHVYYIPNQQIVGISKLARVVDIYARRLQNQERLAKQIADALEQTLKPKGVAIILEAEHFCMKARGVQKQNAVMKTSDIRGVFREKPEARQELFNLIK